MINKNLIIIINLNIKKDDPAQKSKINNIGNILVKSINLKCNKLNGDSKMILDKIEGIFNFVNNENGEPIDFKKKKVCLFIDLIIVVPLSINDDEEENF